LGAALLQPANTDEGEVQLRRTSGGNGWRGCVEWGFAIAKDVDALVLFSAAHKDEPVHAFGGVKNVPRVRLYTLGAGPRLTIPWKQTVFALCAGPQATVARVSSRTVRDAVVEERVRMEYAPGFGFFSAAAVTWRITSTLGLVARVGSSYSFARLLRSITDRGDSTIIYQYVPGGQAVGTERVDGTTITRYQSSGTVESFSAFPLMFGISYRFGRRKGAGSG
jgi:hypothetical protein